MSVLLILCDDSQLPTFTANITMLYTLLTESYTSIFGICTLIYIVGLAFCHQSLIKALLIDSLIDFLKYHSANVFITGNCLFVSIVQLPTNA